jgi:hypothetical protein
MRPWAFLSLAVLGAAWQAVTEVANTGLRAPAAMAVLAMLVSTGNISGDHSPVPYAAAFSAGAIWQALVQYVVARRVPVPHAALAAEFAAVFSTASAARSFIAVMAALAMVGGVIASVLPVPHAAWLLTAALRVMKPLHGDTLQRLKQRFAGTVAGAVFAAGLLAWPLPALLRAGIFGVMLTIMQLVGARRYAAWVFCLTVIALDIGLRPYATGWQPAGISGALDDRRAGPCLPVQFVSAVTRSAMARRLVAAAANTKKIKRVPVQSPSSHSRKT